MNAGPAHFRKRKSRRRRGSAFATTFAHDRRGSIAIEFGLVAPVFLMLLLGIVQGGRVLSAMNALHYSVQEAARCASINPTHYTYQGRVWDCSTPALTQSFAAASSGAQFGASVFLARKTACGNLVSASYPLPLTIPFVMSSLTLTASSCYPT